MSRASTWPFMSPLADKPDPLDAQREQVLDAADEQKRKRGVTLLGRIEPQPPKGIKYMLGNETWLPAHERDLITLHCEEWGNLGPMELDPAIKPNKAGFRVRCTTIIAPPGAHGFTEIEGVYYWTDTSVWDEMAQSRKDHT